MLSTGLKFKQLRQTGSRTELGESPVWDPATEDVWWVDIDGRKLLRARLGSDHVEIVDTPEIPGFVVLTGPERLAVGMQSGIFSFDPRTSVFERMIALDAPGHRFNDATVDRTGRLWASTMALDASPGAASILTVSQDRALDTVITGLSIPNGLAVDVDHGRLYCSDSHPDIRSIWVRPLEPVSGALGEAALFAKTDGLDGRPDGAALDERGHYWIAGVDGAELYVFDRQGRLDERIPVPFPAPTKMCFTGPQARAIALTSKGIGEDGGYLALADLPPSFAPGIAQPYWAIGTGRTN